MAKTVLALYRNVDRAAAAIAGLRSGMLNEEEVSVVTGAASAGILPGVALRPVEGPGDAPLRAAGPLARSLHTEDELTSALKGAGIPEPDSSIYSEAVRRGGTLVLARVPDRRAEEAADLLESHAPEDPDELAAELSRTSEEDPEPERLSAHEENPNEELEVGARQLESEGTLVHREVTEFPVEEPVSLHEEVVEVERRPANRAVDEAGGLHPFEEGEMVFVDTAEQVFVTKTPRIVEEIVIRKRRQVREEIVRDTVRRTELKIQPKRR